MQSESRRSFLRKTAGALGTGTAASLAGCGSDGSKTGTQNDPSSEEDQEPELNDVHLMLSADDTADFTESEEYSLGLEAELQYSDGTTETRELTDYEVENAEVRKTGEGGKYEVVNIDKNTVPNTEFTDEDLKKAGHYQELEDIQIEDGEIILTSDDLITGYSQIDLDINVADQEISEYIGDNTSYQNTFQVDKTEEQALQDLRVQGPEAVELWQKFRELRAEQILENAIIAPSDRFDNYGQFTEVVNERVNEQLADEDNPTLQEELAHWGTQFGRLYMEERNGASPSGGTHRLESILAEAAFHTSDVNVIPGMISDSGHNSNPVFVPGSLNPRDKEFWSGGKTYNVNTKREEAATPPSELSDYASGPYGVIFKDVDKIPRKSEGTFSSFMTLSQNIDDKGHDMIDVDYATSLAPELGDDTELWHDNLQHIMETAVGNLFSTEHDLIPTGSAEKPEVEVR